MVTGGSRPCDICNCLIKVIKRNILSYFGIFLGPSVAIKELIGTHKVEKMVCQAIFIFGNVLSNFGT